MTDDQKPNNQPQKTAQEDLDEHGVSDIIPENEEYYTLNLQRDFDGDNSEELEVDDIVGGNPLSENDYEPASSNAGGPVKEGELVDQNNDNGVQVGDAGHPGVDEDTG